MDVYTGDSAYYRDIGFNEYQKGLADWCDTSSVVNEYVKSICKKLYAKKGGEYAQSDFFDKNFRVVVCDETYVNAAHLYKEFTNDGKSVLYISKGLIENIENEAQLAFVLGHELGHFQVYESDNKDAYGFRKTDHEHEIKADINAFNSMMEAGYDVNEAIKFFESLNDGPKDLKNTMKSAFEAHGDVSTRISNIKAAISVAERDGYSFSQYKGAEEYKTFYKKYKKVADDDHYISFLEDKIRREYNVSSSEELSYKDKLNFLEDIITNSPEILSTGERLSTFAKLLSNDMKEIETENVAQINRIVHKAQDISEEFGEKCLKSMQPVDKNSNKWYAVYGKHKYYCDELSKIVSSVDKSFLVDEIREYWDRATPGYKEVFEFSKYIDFPKFSVEGLDVGDTVAWKKITDLLTADNKQGVETLLNVTGVEYDLLKHKFGDNLGAPISSIDNVYVDGNGVILSKDPEEVKRLNAISKKKVEELNIPMQKKMMFFEFHEQLAIMGTEERNSEKFNEAKEKATEIYRRSKDCFYVIDGKTKDFLLNPHNYSKYVFDEINKNGDFPYLDKYEGDFDTTENKNYMEKFYPQYTEVVLDEEFENIQDVYHSERYFKIAKPVDFVRDFFDYASNEKNRSKDVISKMSVPLFRAYEQMIGDGPYKQTVTDLQRCVTFALLNENVGLEGKVDYVEEFRKKRGLGDIHNSDELLANLKDMHKYDNDNWSYCVTYNKLLYDYEIIRALNDNIDINVGEIIKEIPVSASPQLADKMTEYLDKHKIFEIKEGESVEDAYMRCKQLYIDLSVKNVFSEKDNAHKNYEAKLVNMLQQLPEEKRISEAYSLLCTDADKAVAFSEFSKGRDEQEDQVVMENLKQIRGSIVQFEGNKKIVEEVVINDLVKKLGKDDKTVEYREKINEELENIADSFGTSSRHRICVSVAKRAMAQREVAFDIEEIYNKDVANNKTRGECVRAYNCIDAYCKQKPEFAGDIMKLLLSKGSLQDFSDFSKSLAREYNNNRGLFADDANEKIFKKFGIKADVGKIRVPDDSFISVASQIYEEYLNAPYFERTFVMRDLLDAYVKEEGLSEEEKLQKQIKYVSDRIFGNAPGEEKLLDEVRVISTAVCHQENEPAFVLGGVLASREPGLDDGNMNVGDGLAMFCEKRGTAWVKLAQTLSYVDALPQSIRDSLGRLKDKANEPTQWEIHKDLMEAMPEKMHANVTEVKNFIGGGSFNKTVLVDMKDENSGEVETKVIQVMHERAENKSAEEFKKINGAIAELCKIDRKYEILKSVAERSANNAKIEVDIQAGAKQFEHACKNYGNVASVEINGIMYEPKVAMWETYGKSAYSNYKIMEKAQGCSIDAVTDEGEFVFSEKQRQDMAMAYTITEMSILLGGKEWDIDRHSKQQNFFVTKDENGRDKVEIGVFDTGAQRPAPTKKEKKMLAELLVGVVKEQLTNENANIGEFMLNKIKKWEKKGKDVNYVSDVQRGLLAFSDVMKHMNTKDNPNGMIEGITTAFTTLQKQGLIDKDIEKQLKIQLLKEMISSPKFAKKAIKMIKNKTDNNDKVKVDIADKTRKNKPVVMDKPKSETDEIDLNKTRIRPRQKTPKEKVAEKLKSWGIKEGEYMLITPSDGLRTSYDGIDDKGNPVYSRELFWDEYKKDLKEAGSDVVMGSNNGVTGAYFAEGVYVVGGTELRDKLYYHAKDVGLGVILSNGDTFKNEWGKDYFFKNKEASLAVKGYNVERTENELGISYRDGDDIKIKKCEGKGNKIEYEFKVDGVMQTVGFDEEKSKAILDKVQSVGFGERAFALKNVVKEAYLEERGYNIEKKGQNMCVSYKTGEEIEVNSAEKKITYIENGKSTEFVGKEAHDIIANMNNKKSLDEQVATLKSSVMKAKESRDVQFMQMANCRAH